MKWQITLKEVAKQEAYDWIRESDLGIPINGHRDEERERKIKELVKTIVDMVPDGGMILELSAYGTITPNLQDCTIVSQARIA